MMQRRAAARAVWFLRVVLAAIVLIMLAGATDTARAHSSEEFVVRIAARLHTDGKVEFGIQRIDDQGTPRGLYLERHRLFPDGVTHHRWLRGDATFLLEAPHYEARGGDPSVPVGTHSTKVRVIARLHPVNGKVEFALQHELDIDQWVEDDDYSDPVLPNKRFFPNDVTHHRWLYSGEIRFTRAWADEGMMEPEPTLESETGSYVNPPDVSEPVTLEMCLSAIAAGNMVPENCDEPLLAHCEANPEFASQYPEWCSLPADEEDRQSLYNLFKAGSGRHASHEARTDRKIPVMILREMAS